MKSKLKLHENEKIIFQLKPKMSLAFYQSFMRVLRYVVILGIFASFSSLHLYSKLQDQNVLYLAPMAGGFLAIFLIYLSIKIGQVRGLTYTFTDQRIVRESTFFAYSKKILNYSLVNDVDMTTNPVRQILGITGVVIQQPGAGLAAKTTLDGLSHDDADKVVDFVSKKITEK